MSESTVKALAELLALEADGKHADECSIEAWERARDALRGYQSTEWEAEPVASFANFLQEFIERCEHGDIDEDCENADWRHLYTEAQRYLELMPDGEWTVRCEYLNGHHHALQWAGDLAEAEDPRTSDWKYDDPHELAKAIRKGPEMPRAAPPRPRLRRDTEGESIEEYRAAMGWSSQSAPPPPAEGEVAPSVTGEAVAVVGSGFQLLWTGGESFAEHAHKHGIKVGSKLYLAPPPAEAAPSQHAEEMSPDFTDTARAALLWVLWHHQGASSKVGQPIRFALGMGQHEPLNKRQIAAAKSWAPPHPHLAHEAPDNTPAEAASAPQVEVDADEHPAARRNREQFEAKYGDLAGVMRMILAWRLKWAEFQRPYNRDMAEPVSEEQVEQAERGMLMAIRGYAARPSAPAREPSADTLLRVLQRLNQIPYNLTKAECIQVVQEMRDDAISEQLRALPLATPSPAEGSAAAPAPVGGEAVAISGYVRDLSKNPLEPKLHWDEGFRCAKCGAIGEGKGVPHLRPDGSECGYWPQQEQQNGQDGRARRAHQGDAQTPTNDPEGVSRLGWAGANQHHEHRERETTPDNGDSAEDRQGTGLQGDGSLRASVVATPIDTTPVGGEGWTQAARDVLAERQRQISVEGWAPEHDDEHGNNSMAVAAAVYALSSLGNALAVRTVRLEKLWEWTGWASHWWKPKDKRHNLIRAGALILAEIERIDRSAAPQQGGVR